MFLTTTAVSEAHTAIVYSVLNTKTMLKNKENKTTVTMQMTR